MGKVKDDQKRRELELAILKADYSELEELKLTLEKNHEEEDSGDESPDEDNWNTVQKELD